MYSNFSNHMISGFSNFIEITATKVYQFNVTKRKQIDIKPEMCDVHALVF